MHSNKAVSQLLHGITHYVHYYIHSTRNQFDVVACRFIYNYNTVCNIAIQVSVHVASHTLKNNLPQKQLHKAKCIHITAWTQLTRSQLARSFLQVVVSALPCMFAIVSNVITLDACHCQHCLQCQQCIDTCTQLSSITIALLE